MTIQESKGQNTRVRYHNDKGYLWEQDAYPEETKIPKKFLKQFGC